MSRKLTEALGWYGVVAILLAYVLLNFEVVGVHSLAYQVLNLTGGLGIIIDAWKQKNYQPAVLNAIWAIVAVIAIINLL